MAKKPDPQPTKLIRVTGPEKGRWRGRFGTSRHFTPDTQEFNDLMLSADEIAELQEDPELKVEVIGLAATDPAPMDPVPVDPAPAGEPVPAADSAAPAA